MTCSNHAANLTIITVPSCAGIALTSSLYSLGAFLYLGGHFLRLGAKVAGHVSFMLSVVAFPITLTNRNIWVADITTSYLLS